MFNNFVQSFRIMKTFSLNKKSKILEIGSGSNPLFVSNILLDKFPFIVPEHRSSLKPVLLDSRPFIMADGENLPFSDKSMDLIISRHVIEHLDDPLTFFNEIQRIGKMAYISAPSPFVELVSGGYRIRHPKYRQLENVCRPGIGTQGHKWIVFSGKDKLIMLKKARQYYPVYLVFSNYIKGTMMKKPSIYSNMRRKYGESRFISFDLSKSNIQIFDYENQTDQFPLPESSKLSQHDRCYSQKVTSFARYRGQKMLWDMIFGKK